jgi:hypothetical protein
MSFEQWATLADTAPHTKVNEALGALVGAAVYGRRPQADSGLTIGIHGGRWSTFVRADATITLAASATNYYTVDRATGTPNVSSSATNWTNTAAYARVYIVPTDAAGPNWPSAEDHRYATGGLLDAGAGSGLAAHIAAADPHPQYLTPAEGDARYVQSLPAITDVIACTVKTVANESIRLLTAAPFAGTITVVTTRCASGTATLTTKINGTSIGPTNAVSSTEATQAHSDAFAAGDDIDIEFSANSACLMANVVITYTRALS